MATQATAGGFYTAQDLRAAADLLKRANRVVRISCAAPLPLVLPTLRGSQPPPTFPAKASCYLLRPSVPSLSGAHFGEEGPLPSPPHSPKSLDDLRIPTLAEHATLQVVFLGAGMNADSPRNLLSSL